MPVVERRPEASLTSVLSETLRELRDTTTKLRAARNGNPEQNQLINRVAGILDGARQSTFAQLPHLVLNTLTAPPRVEEQQAPASTETPIRKPVGVIFEEPPQPPTPEIKIKAPRNVTVVTQSVVIPDGFVPLPEALRLIGVSMTTWHRIKSGVNCETVKVGPRTLYRAEDLLAIKQERKDGVSRRKIQPTASHNDFEERDGTGLDSRSLYDRELNEIGLLTAKEEQTLSAGIYLAKFALRALRQLAMTGDFPASLTARVQLAIATGQYLLEEFDEEIVHRSTNAKDDTDRKLVRWVEEFDNTLPVEIRKRQRAMDSFIVELLEEVERGKKAFNHLVEHNLRLVRKNAHKLKWTARELPVEDLIGYGNLGLMKAASRFDWEKGNKFSTYATWWIIQFMKRAIADHDSGIRVPVHVSDELSRIRHGQTTTRKVEDSTLKQGLQALNIISLNTVINDSGYGQTTELGDVLEGKEELVEDQVAALQLIERVNDALEALDLRERAVIEMRYGLNGKTPMTLGKIGDVFGVTRERIRQIEIEALKKLRDSSCSDQLRDFVA